MPRSTPSRGPHPLDVVIGQRIRARRRSLGMSQQRLAEAVGLTFQQIQKYERGANRVSASRLLEIAGALGCRFGDLVEGLDLAAPVGSGDSLAHLLAADGALGVLEAYAALSNRAVQRSVLLHVKSLAKALPSNKLEPPA